MSKSDCYLLSSLLISTLSKVLERNSGFSRNNNAISVLSFLQTVCALECFSKLKRRKAPFVAFVFIKRRIRFSSVFLVFIHIAQREIKLVKNLRKPVLFIVVFG